MGAVELPRPGRGPAEIINGAKHRPSGDPAFEVEDERPSADDPLRGLKHLGPIALLGRERILALAAKPIEYVWKDIAVAGTTVLLAGAPGCGKTTLLFLLLTARANNGPAVALLDRIVRPAPTGQRVVLIEGEHSEASTSRKLVKALRVLGVHDDALDRVIIVARKAVQLGSPAWNDVVKLICEGLVSDIAIDTIARVAPSDANEEREQVTVFELVAQAIEQSPEQAAKPVCWIVAHTRKNGTSGDLTDVAGSVQRVGQADSVLLMTGEKIAGRTVSTTVTFAKLREDPDAYPDPSTFRITEGVLLTDSAADDPTKPLSERILELLEVAPRSKWELRKLLKAGDAAVEKAISELFKAQLIRTGSRTHKGKTHKTFELAAGLQSAQDMP